MSSLSRRRQQAPPQTAEPALAPAPAPAPAVMPAAPESGLAAPESESPTLDAAGGAGGVAAAGPPPAAAEAQTEAPTEAEAKEDAETGPQGDPNVSRNAEDPAPSGWASKEIATVPASKVDPADQGHVYHLLEDGSVVVTSVPFTVTGPVADAVRADAQNRVKPTENRAGNNNVAVDTNAHALPQALEFESKLGLRAMADGDAAGSAVMDQIAGFLVSYATVLEEASTQMAATAEGVQARLATSLPKLGTTDATVAGAVGTDPHVLIDAMANGNLREKMTILFNFMRFFNEGMLKMTEAQRDTVIGSAELNAGLLADRIGDLEAQTPAVDPTAPATAEAPSGADQLASPGEGKTLRNTTTGEFALGPKTRTSLTDVDPKLIGGQDRARIDGGNKASSRTIASLDGTNAELSDREKAVQEKALGETETLDTATLRWNEGADKWMADKNSEFVQLLEATQVPFGAGPSGTTARLMSTAQQLGYTDAIGMRLACMGYLLPIRAHSLIEVMVSAAAYGCPAPQPGLMMYTEIAPYDAGTLKGFSGGKFPHEWAAENAGNT
jgi:hypothetical protein